MKKSGDIKEVMQKEKPQPQEKLKPQKELKLQEKLKTQEKLLCKAQALNLVKLSKNVVVQNKIYLQSKKELNRNLVYSSQIPARPSLSPEQGPLPGGPLQCQAEAAGARVQMWCH